MLAGSSTIAPQRDAPARGHYSAPIPYDGRFTLVRLRWAAGRPWARDRVGTEDAWSRDYPLAEQNLSAIIRALTYLDVHDDGNEILTLDDPDLFKYPIAIMWAPGSWTLTGREAESFRAYLLKGGFAIFEGVDPSSGRANFEAQLQRVLPDGRLLRVDSTHQVFKTFFAVKDTDRGGVSRTRPNCYGIFEDNDPSKRLMVVANYDHDVRVPRLDQAPLPFDLLKEGDKLGVNYMIYGLSH